jgi:hypothetical protein
MIPSLLAILESPKPPNKLPNTTGGQACVTLSSNTLKDALHAK